MLAPEAQITASQVLSAFHHDQGFLFLGASFITVSLLCAAFPILNRKLDALLLWLAAFAFLYGLRLWIDTEIVGFTLGDMPLFGRIEWAINFLTPVPAFLFFQTAGLLPRRGKIYTTALITLFVALALTTLFVGRLPILHKINNIAVIAALPFILVRTYLQGAVNRDFVIMRRGLLCFVLLALFDNTVGDYWLHRSIEPYGFAVFLGCLGYVAVHRALQRDREYNEIQQELGLARRMQLAILPASFPSSRSFQVAAKYVPMTSVAGDFYDFVQTDEQHLGLLIADVSGHGVPAALIASMVKMAATSQRTQAADPAALLGGMNAALCGNTQGQYVTAAYVYLDGCAKQLHYSAAGHPAMLLLRNGAVTEIAENGMLLAAVEGASYDIKTLPLEAGDRLLLYTDGLIEARSAEGKLFGEESLAVNLRASAHMTPSEVVEHLIASVRSWSRVQDDDLTVLVCDYVGAPELSAAD